MHVNAERLADLLAEASDEETGAAELRLSDAEKAYLLRKYPGIRLKRMENGQCSDGKSWYELV